MHRPQKRDLMHTQPASSNANEAAIDTYIYDGHKYKL